MKCNQCGKVARATDVKAQTKQGMKVERRFRGCPDGHKMTTYEVDQKVFNRLLAVEKAKESILEMGRIIGKL